MGEVWRHSQHPALAEEKCHRLRGAWPPWATRPSRALYPVIWDPVWIPRQASLGKLEARGLQASVCHFQLGSCTSAPASPHPAPPCPEVLGHLSLDTPRGAILWHSGPFRTHFRLPPASALTGPLDGPPSPCTPVPPPVPPSNAAFCVTTSCQSPSRPSQVSPVSCSAVPAPC